MKNLDKKDECYIFVANFIVKLNKKTAKSIFNIKKYLFGMNFN